MPHHRRVVGPRRASCHLSPHPASLTQILQLQTTLQLCALNPAKIHLVVRNQARGELAVRLVREVAPSYAGELVVWELDLANFASVRRFFDEYELDRLDCLILNAGEASDEWTMTEDGWESMSVRQSVVGRGKAADRVGVGCR